MANSKSLIIKAAIKAQDLMSGPVLKISNNVNNRLGKALKNSKLQADRLGTSVQKLGKNLSSFSQKNKKYAIGLLNSAKTARDVYTKYVDYASNLGKFSRQVGVSVEELQKLRYAAERSGVSGDVLDKSLEHLSMSTGKMAEKSGSLYKYLNKVDPALKKQLLNTKDNSKAFELLVGAISKTESSSQKAALAKAAFGSSGKDMIKMTEGGVKGLNEYKKTAEELGIITTKQSKQSDAASLAISNLKKATDGVSNAIFAKLSPHITEVTNKITEWITKNRELIADKVAKGIESFAEKIAKIDFSKIIDDVGKAAEEVDKFVEKIGGWENVILFLVLHMSGLTKIVLGLAKVFMSNAVQSILGVLKVLRVLSAFMVTNPILAAIALIAVAAYLIYENWEPISAFFKDIWAKIKDSTSEFIEKVNEKWASFKEKVKEVWGSITTYVSEKIDKIKEYYNKYLKPIVDAVKGAGKYIPGVMSGHAPPKIKNEDKANRLKQPPISSKIQEQIKTINKTSKQDIGGTLTISVEADKELKTKTKQTRQNSSNFSFETNTGPRKAWSM